MTQLAIHGGPPVWSAPWPNWPQSTDQTLRNLQDVLGSHRWSISGQYRGEPSWERRFGEAFAAYTGARHCVPASTGTASLTMALEACDVGAHDEVIVPGVSWVASVSAVLGINAIPVLVDIDPATGCIDPMQVERAITPRTRAITVVHLGSAVAELEPLAAIAARHAIPLIEDCAQAHGARYAGRHVGLFGAAGTFSMQHSKLLTSGEGGAVITNDSALARRLAHLRADGRIFTEQPPRLDEMELVETAEVMGSNYCLSEFHAAILVAQLETLEAGLAIRRRNAARLDWLLAGLGFAPQQTAPGTTARAHYNYVVGVPKPIVEAVTLHRFADALAAEIGLPCKTMYAALNANRLYQPYSRRRFALGKEFADAVDPARYSLPASEAFSRSCVALPHRMLLADEAAMDSVAGAFEKLSQSVGDLRR